MCQEEREIVAQRGLRLSNVDSRALKVKIMRVRTTVAYQWGTKDPQRRYLAAFSWLQGVPDSGKSLISVTTATENCALVVGTGQ